MEYMILLMTLLDKGVRLAVFSNKADELTRIIVRELLPGIHFEMILGAQPGIPRKPDPAGAVLIAGSMGIAASRIIYAGDSDVDMITAVKAGMMPVGVLWGFRTGDELSANGAKALLKIPAELLELPGCNFMRQKT